MTFRATLAAAAAGLVTSAGAQTGMTDDAYPLRLEVGESVAICATGAVLCPAGVIQCDDPSLLSIAGDARGPVLTGTKPGTTLCSAGAAGGAGMRRIFRLTVVSKRKA